MDIIKSLEKSKRKHFCMAGSRIRCTLTSHELPPSIDALLSYANGKKFKCALASLAAQEAAPAELRKFLTHSGQSSQSAGDGESGSSLAPKQLFCQLTCRFLSDTPADVARHLAGRRFQLALQAYKAARASGRPFRPSSSLFAKHRQLFTLDGVATGGVVPDDEAEAASDQAVLMEAEGEDPDGDEEQLVESGAEADPTELAASAPLKERSLEQPSRQPHGDRKRKTAAAGRAKSVDKKKRVER